jgi:hypothetical protein
MSRRKRQKSDDDKFKLPISERRFVKPGFEIPFSKKAMLDAVQRGEVVALNDLDLDELFPPMSPDGGIDAFHPHFVDPSTMAQSQASLEYSFSARVIGVTFRPVLDELYRDLRRTLPLGDEIAGMLFDLRHEQGIAKALEFFPEKEAMILDTVERFRVVAHGAIPAYWSISPNENHKIPKVIGRYPVIVYGAATILLQLPIPA